MLGVCVASFGGGLGFVVCLFSGRLIVSYFVWCLSVIVGLLVLVL